MLLRELSGRHFALQSTYALPGDAWMVELSEAVPAPAAWADTPNAMTHLPGAAFLFAEVPDEDPLREPVVHLVGSGEVSVPYDIMRWFMDEVAEEVERCRVQEAETDQGEGR